MTAAPCRQSAFRTSTALVVLLLGLLALGASMASATAGRMLASQPSGASRAAGYIGSWAASPLLRRRATQLGSSRLTQQPRHQPRASFSRGRAVGRPVGTGLRDDITRLWSSLSNNTKVSQVGIGLDGMVWMVDRI